LLKKFKGVELLRQGVTSVGGIDNTGTNDPDGVRALGNTQADAFQGHQFSLWALGMSGGAQRLQQTVMPPAGTIAGAETAPLSSTPRM
jgi:hypothetical protein